MLMTSPVPSAAASRRRLVEHLRRSVGAVRVVVAMGGRLVALAAVDPMNHVLVERLLLLGVVVTRRYDGMPSATCT